MPPLLIPQPPTLLTMTPMMLVGQVPPVVTPERASEVEVGQGVRERQDPSAVCVLKRAQLSTHFLHV